MCPTINHGERGKSLGEGSGLSGSAEREETVDKIKCLKTRVNNMISILTLIGIFAGSETYQIVKVLLDWLLSMLRLDFVYVKLKGSAGSMPIEMSQFTQSENSAWQERGVNEVLKALLRCETQTRPLVVWKSTEEGDVSIAVFRLGLNDEMGWLVAGSRRTDFPDASEKLLLDAAVDQASIGLQKA